MTCNLPFEKKQHHNHGRTLQSHMCKDKLPYVYAKSAWANYTAQAQMI